MELKEPIVTPSGRLTTRPRPQDYRNEQDYMEAVKKYEASKGVGAF